MSALAPNYARYPVEFAEGAGCMLRDADGVEYLDFLSGIGVCNTGHCHPAVVGAELVFKLEVFRRRVDAPSANLRSALTLFPVDGERERVALPAVTSNPLTELLAAMGGTREPSVTAEDGRAAVSVVEAAYRSAAAGCTMIAVD